VLDWVVTVPTTRPAFVIAAVAAVCVRPTTFGTATCGGPDDTTRSTSLPAETCVPDSGDWLITEPAATVVLDCVVTVPTTRPALVIAVVAAACVRPTTSGTVAPAEAVPTRISTAAEFQRSLVGDGLLIVATVPAAATGALSVWSQKVLADAVSIH
jgi:hypothetical protein